MVTEVDVLLEQLASRAGLLSREEFRNVSGAHLGRVLQTMDSISPEFVQSLGQRMLDSDPASTPCRMCSDLTTVDLLH